MSTIEEQPVTPDSNPVSESLPPTPELDEKEIFPSQKSWADRPIVRIGLNLATVFTVGLLLFVIWQRFLVNRSPDPVSASASQAKAEQSENIPSADQGQVRIELAPIIANLATPDGIFRRLEFRTTIPSRPRVDVITYTVQKGDTLFSIADEYGIEPETLLWSNFETLNDNPHLLSPDQVLNILPVNGVYYEWQDGDHLGNVASYFQVDQQAILEFPGNDFDLTAGEAKEYGLQPGQWLVIPGGKRAIKDWGPPAISRDNPAAAKYYGEGSCGSVYEGAVGSGTFVWPTTDRNISGYTYSGVHPAVDIGGSIGNSVFAADSGVIVYAGWSSHGYGNLIVIDHGNGFQTAYAHLDTVGVGCGQSVFQGGYIGGLGSTGNSSGPHLHFEIVYNGAKPNPMDFLQ